MAGRILKKETIKKDDGRYLILYSWSKEKEAGGAVTEGRCGNCPGREQEETRPGGKDR